MRVASNQAFLSGRGYRQAAPTFSSNARACRQPARRHDFTLLCRLHKSGAQILCKMTNNFFPKTLDICAHLWYNISVRGRAVRQSRPIRKVPSVPRQTVPLQPRQLAHSPQSRRAVEVRCTSIGKSTARYRNQQGEDAEDGTVCAGARTASDGRSRAKRFSWLWGCA